MNNLIIDNHIIKKDIRSILDLAKSQITNGKLKTIKYNDVDNVTITCPYHNDGLENNPSCSIYTGNSEKLQWGNCHCFTCGFSGPLWHFIAECFDKSDKFGKDWLKKYFTESIVSEESGFEDDIVLPTRKKKTLEKEKKDIKLSSFQKWHPYMEKRKLTKEICERFNVKYDPKTECIVFPVYDEKGKLVFLTRRSVNSKQFIIDKDTEKPVYLLNEIIKNNIKEVYVCESQINCLTLWGWGYPAIALFGTGTNYQYDILNNTDILVYHLCLDGDSAGYSGIKRFIKNIKKSCFIDIVRIPIGKDVNDLTKDQFLKLEIIDKSCIFN